MGDGVGGRREVLEGGTYMYTYGWFRRCMAGTNTIIKAIILQLKNGLKNKRLQDQKSSYTWKRTTTKMWGVIGNNH